MLFRSTAYQKLKRKTLALKKDAEGTVSVTEAGNKLRAAFKDTLADDLNTANAITVLYDVLKSDLLDA